MKQIEEYKPGGKYRGHLITGISTKFCEKHQRNKFMLYRHSKTRGDVRINACIECWRNTDRTYWARRLEKLKATGDDVKLHMPRQTSGIRSVSRIEGYLWNPGVDKKIAEFWKKRGIDPVLKFRSKMFPPRRKSA